MLRRSWSTDVAIGFWGCLCCYKLKKIYVLYENFMYTGLPLVLSPCHFVLTSAALIAPVFYYFALVSARVLASTMRSASSWWVRFSSSGLSFLTLLPGAPIVLTFYLWSQCSTLPLGPRQVFSGLSRLSFITMSN